MKCRFCSSKLDTILNLGALYTSAFIEKDKKGFDYSKLYREPLSLARCSKCALVQLEDTVPLDSIYRQYWYKSGLNESMKIQLKEVVEEAKKRVNLRFGDTVIDIGANDGTLLSNWGSSYFKIGFDPALNLREEAENHCDLFINDYFYLPEIEKQSYIWEVEGRYTVIRPDFINSQAKVVTSIAMFYDLDDINTFVEDVKRILHPEGIWVVQFQDLMSMLKSGAYDNICHEHLEYYSLEVLFNIFLAYELDIFDVEYNKTNGGSVRVYVCHKDSRRIQNSVVKARKEEWKFFEKDQLTAFANRAYRDRLILRGLLEDIVEKGQTVYGLGASTKGNTLLQFCNIHSELLPKIGEVNKDKWGLYTIGTNIPIVPEEVVLAENPDYLLILPWHFKEFFKQKLNNYLDAGGQLIFPIGGDEETNWI